MSEERDRQTVKEKGRLWKKTAADNRPYSENLAGTYTNLAGSGEREKGRCYLRNMIFSVSMCQPIEKRRRDWCVE